MKAATPLHVVVGGDRVALGGALDRIAMHEHATPAVVVGIDGPLELVADRTHASRAALLAPGFRHAVEVRATRIAVFLLPPRAVAQPVVDLQPARWLELGHAIVRGELDDFSAIDRVLARDGITSRALDDRLLTVTRAIAGALDRNLPVEELAGVAGVSASRLMALARAQLGTSLRSYRRWLRTFGVAEAYARGASLTEAAYAAGFSSSAHLSAAAREHFGIRPSQILSPANRPFVTTVGS